MENLIRERFGCWKWAETGKLSSEEKREDSLSVFHLYVPVIKKIPRAIFWDGLRRASRATSIHCSKRYVASKISKSFRGVHMRSRTASFSNALRYVLNMIDDDVKVLNRNSCGGWALSDSICWVTSSPLHLIQLHGDQFFLIKSLKNCILSYKVPFITFYSGVLFWKKYILHKHELKKACALRGGRRRRVLRSGLMRNTMNRSKHLGKILVQPSS